MTKKALLVLEDGSSYEGYTFGAESRGDGEVVFNTSMTGYQEILTDPSYAGQIVVPTYPMIGNYGINSEHIESRRIQVSGFVVREDCPAPSHFQSNMTLSQYLAASGIPGIGGVDTRAITRKLRSRGVMMGVITSDESPEAALARLKGLARYDNIDFVRKVTTPATYEWEKGEVKPPHVVVFDCGVKYNILRSLRRRECRVTAVPCTTQAEDILNLGPDGIVLSPGPGDPALLDYAVNTVRTLIGRKPIMGICLGHQLLGKAFGGSTFKLKFGHRGGNHPVRDPATGRVYITAQNHGYAADDKGLKGGLEVSQVNLNDWTVEGFRHRDLPIFSIQYHSEASPGPWDNMYLFDKFLETVKTSH